MPDAVMQKIRDGVAPSPSFPDKQSTNDVAPSLLDTVAAAEESKNHVVPDLTELKINAMLKTINDNYDSLPKDPSKHDLKTAYGELCQQKYFTGKLNSMYPFARWNTCRKIRHPVDVMKVSACPTHSRYHPNPPSRYHVYYTLTLSP